jgi:hypothetical protein
MPVPSQGHYGFHSFPAVGRFCLFIYLCKTNLNSVLIPICTNDGLLYPKSSFTAKILNAYEYEYHDHDENKLHFDEMLMMSAFYKINRPSWVFIVLPQWNNSPDIAGKTAHLASELLTHALTQFSRCHHTFKTNLNSVLIPICTNDGLLYPTLFVDIGGIV